jgi:hypothetical protein
VWTILEFTFIGLGLLLILGGDRLSLPVLSHAGIACLGLAMIAVGWQAILTRRLVVRGRGGRYPEAYSGVPAIFQGIQFNFIGLFFIGIAFITYFNDWHRFFFQLVRRPGLPLVLLGGLALFQAMIMFWGRGGTGERSPGLLILELLVGRLFPGFIWLILGLGLMMLGLFDAVAPVKFDEIGGAFLEELYGLR